MTKYVYLFTEGNGNMRELLGGKPCFADVREDSKMFDEWLAKADKQFDDIRYGDADTDA